MLFNSYEFIFAYLPVVFIGYFLLNRFKFYNTAKIWMALASLFFYAYEDTRYLPLILGSIAFNYLVGRGLSHINADGVNHKGRWLLILGIVGDVGLLAYYKYADFFIENYNGLLSQDVSLLHIALPLGISFFTFTQLAYLVDAYRGKVKEYNIANYILFVTFFPHLIAGPILHHKEMMPQFDDPEGKRIRADNISRGIFIFCIGLFKKVIIADLLAPIATAGFDSGQPLHLVEAWTTSLAYTGQLYFDFSAYSDMAIGLGLIFNIKLPVNFNSPYKGTSIKDFWARWHMTLSRFLKDYIYIPLGGNRKGTTRTYINLFLTFLIGGFWHGAGWTFIIWGAMHGAAQVVQRLWQLTGIKMNKYVGWFITFNFVNIAWVFFRAQHWSDGVRILKGMFGMSGVILPPDLLTAGLPLVAAALLIALFARNSIELTERFKPTFGRAVFAAALFIVSLLYFNQISEFLYFNF